MGAVSLVIRRVVEDSLNLVEGGRRPGGGDARGRDCQRGFTPPLADGFVMFGGGDIRQHGWGIQYVGTITVCIHLRTILLHDKGKMRNL